MAMNPRVTDWRTQHVWLLGASTGIGRATASHLHALGAQVTVSARHRGALEAFVTTHPGAQALALDVTDAQAVQAATQTLVAQHGRIDLALYCAGHYRAMSAQSFDLADASRHQQVNYQGALNWLAAMLPVAARQADAGQPAHLSLVASVAGYRGLPNALAYGPTKAALINLAEVLYMDLQPKGVGVSLINPGFVDTPLTAQNAFHMPALISPETAALDIVQGWERGDFEIDFPKRFTRLLKAMRHLPNWLYLGAVRRAVRV